MIPGTHLLICNILYKYLLKKTNFVLDYKAFSYGSIKPDIEKWSIKCDHTFEASIRVVDSYAKRLMSKKMSQREFSVGLGVVCHFVSDYFCLHHQREYWKRDSMAHGIYEIKLHAEILKLVLNDKLRVDYSCKEEDTVSKVVMKFKAKYDNEPEAMMKDISYSIAASAAVSEMIIRKKLENMGYSLT
jgi:predicted transcriptional regulator